MNIIIAGAGQVGFNLAKTLSRDNDVIVIDQNQQALAAIAETLDILPINGDIKNPLIYENILEKEIDFFLAVTNSDEANLISIIVAQDRLEVKKSILRLKNRYFGNSSLKRKFGIDSAVFAIDITSKTISNLLKYPKANNVKQFEYTDKELISIKVTKINGPVEVFPKGYEIVGIERNREFIIPAKNRIIEPGDLIYLFGDKIEIHHFCKEYASDYTSDNQNIVIFSADEMGIAIAKELLKEEKDIKIVDNDINKCKIANERLEGKVTILNSKYSTIHLYDDEGLKHADIAIAATKNDEYNIIKCLEAKERGIKKVIAINNDLEYYSLMHSLGIVVVRGPKIATVNAILENINSDDAVIKKIFCGGKGQIYMRKVYENSSLIGIHVKVLKYRDNLLTFVIRDGQIIHCDDAMICEEGDVIAVFCNEENEEEAKNWIYNLGQ